MTTIEENRIQAAAAKLKEAADELRAAGEDPLADQLVGMAESMLAYDVVGVFKSKRRFTIALETRYGESLMQKDE